MTVKPAITVIDAVEILEHNGPVTGKKRELGLLFGAKDVFCRTISLRICWMLTPTTWIYCESPGRRH